MIYLASPYSSPLPTVVEDRIRRTSAFVLLMQQQGYVVFSPILYFHPIATALKLPTDAAYWHRANMAFLRKAEAIFALRLDGWDQSKGMKIELNLAATLDIPVIHFSRDFQQLQPEAPAKPSSVTMNGN